jgi:hypothetical protein
MTLALLPSDCAKAASSISGPGSTNSISTAIAFGLKLATTSIIRASVAREMG